MRWPNAWKDPASLSLLKGSPIDCLLVESKAGLGPLVEEAGRIHLPVAEAGSPPAGVEIVKGNWPGVDPTQGTGGLAAGPTGEPWVDSNGWKIRLAQAMSPGRQIWVNAPPAEPRLGLESYVLAVVDAGAYGARWILSLDEKLAADIAAGSGRALQTWHKLTDAARFFNAHQQWSTYQPEAVAGVVAIGIR